MNPLPVQQVDALLEEDFFAGSTVDESTPLPLPPLDDEEPRWDCAGCRGNFPRSLEPDIVLLDDPRVKFCSAGCAEMRGHTAAAESYRSAYVNYGHTSVALTPAGRLPDARSSRDRARYAEALAEQAERETYRPAILAVPAAPVATNPASVEPAP
jgi:hypothetical protein